MEKYNFYKNEIIKSLKLRYSLSFFPFVGRHDYVFKVDDMMFIDKRTSCVGYPIFNENGTLDEIPNEFTFKYNEYWTKYGLK